MPDLPARRGHVAVTEQLIAARCKVDLQVWSRCTRSTSRPKMDMQAQVLLAAHCDTNVHNDDGRTPLLLAARNGHHAVAQLLMTARQGV
jgi:ankyrin repeat protein